MIRAILACDDGWGIGKDNKLPWPHNSADLKWFKECTYNGIVVMGRNTWDSLPSKPLKGRTNMVVSDTMSPRNDCEVVKSDIFKSRMSVVKGHETRDLWVIGGAKLFSTALDIIDEIWLSRIEYEYGCDVFLPSSDIKSQFVLSENMFGEGLHIEKWTRK